VESSLFAKHSVENTSIVFKETEMIRMGEGLKRFSWIVLALLLLCGLPAWAQSQSAASRAGRLPWISVITATSCGGSTLTLSPTPRPRPSARPAPQWSPDAMHAVMLLH